MVFHAGTVRDWSVGVAGRVAGGLVMARCDVKGLKRGEVCGWCPKSPQCGDWRDGRRQGKARDFRATLREREAIR